MVAQRGFCSSWFRDNRFSSFLRTVDPDLDSILQPYSRSQRDPTLLETHGERSLELLINMAPYAEWVEWLFRSLMVAARADNVDVFQRLFALCGHTAEFWTPWRTGSLVWHSGGYGSIHVLSAILEVDIFSRCAGSRESYPCMPPMPPLVMAAMGGYRSCVSVLIEAGAHLKQTGRYSGTALAEAVDKGHEGVVLELLAAGVDVNNIKGDGPSTIDYRYRGYTPLCIAAARNNECMVDILLAAGAGFGNGGTYPLPVIIAAAKGFCGPLKRLLSAGTDVNVIDPRGRSALNAACFHGHEGTVELLLRHNASVVSRCDQGRLPCDVVAMGVLEKRFIRGHPSTLDAIEASAADRIHEMLKVASAWCRRGWLVMMRARRLVALRLLDDASFAKPSPVAKAPQHGDETKDDAEEDVGAAVESWSLADVPSAGTPGGFGDEKRTPTSTETLAAG